MNRIALYISAAILTLASASYGVYSMVTSGSKLGTPAGIERKVTDLFSVAKQEDGNVGITSNRGFQNVTLSTLVDGNWRPMYNASGNSGGVGMYGVPSQATCEIMVTHDSGQRESMHFVTP